MGRALGAVAAVVCLLAAAPALATAAADPPDPGQITAENTTSDGREYRSVLYTPSSYRAGREMPLVVMVHGCQTTATEQMRATRFNRLAEREGFVVLYPDVDEVGRAQPGPIANCWKFFDPTALGRGTGDPAAIAEMTKAVMAKRAIDAERVYLVGISAGGLMASLDAAGYPDLYAAVGIVASAGYADAPCFTSGTGIPVVASAQLAFEQMGPRARVVPRLVIGSDGDLAFPAVCSEKASEQGLRTNNLVLSGAQDGPLALTPAATREEPNPGGFGATVSTYRDPAGCLVGERWIIHGMPHAWPGGTTDPEFKNFTDPKGPNGAEISWAFLRRYTKSGTAMPCAETPGAPGTGAPVTGSARCRATWLRVRLPAGTRKVTAKVGGRRAAVRRTRGGVRVRVPAGTRARTKIVVAGRSKASRRVTRRATARGCG